MEYVKCPVFVIGGGKDKVVSGKASEEINLSADKDFNQFYMDYMYLERD